MMTNKPWNHITVCALHKSGTMFLFRLFQDISKIMSLDMLSDNNDPPNMHQLKSCANCIIGPYRTFPKALNERDAYIFVLRNPLDILVSEYYSFGWTHPNTYQISEIRPMIQQLSIDEYCIKFKENLRYRYQPLFSYINNKSDNILILQYSDMVLHFDIWLSNLCVFLSISDNDKLKLIAKFQEEFTNIPNISHQEIVENNVKAHKRFVLPNDHLNKLQPHTIDVLNQYYSKIIPLCQSTNIPQMETDTK